MIFGTLQLFLVPNTSVKQKSCKIDISSLKLWAINVVASFMATLYKR